MSKKKDKNKKASNENRLALVILITAILNLIQAVIDLIKHLLE